MKQDCKTIECKSVKNSVLFKGGNSTPYSVAGAQAAYDAYIAAGYVQFDASTAHSLDVSGEADDNIIIVWKSADPMKGEYRIKESYFTGKNIIIMGVKLDGSDNVTSANLKIYVNEIESGATDYPITFDGIEVVVCKKFSDINWTSIRCNKATVRLVRNATIAAAGLDNTDIVTYASLNITSDNQIESAKVSSASLTQKGIISSVSTQQANPIIIRALGAYIYVLNDADEYLEYYDRETGVYVDRVSLGTTGTTCMCGSGNKLFGFFYNTGASRVDVWDATIGPSSITINSQYLNIGGITEILDCIADEEYVYFTISGLTQLWQFHISAIASNGYISIGSTGNIEKLVQDTLYVYCQVGTNRSVVSIVEKSSFTETDVIGFTYGSDDDSEMIIAGDYLYSVYKDTGILKILILPINGDAESSINIYSGEYKDAYPCGYDGQYIYFISPGTESKIWRSTPGTIVLEYLFSITANVNPDNSKNSFIVDYYRFIYLSGTAFKILSFNDPTYEANFEEQIPPDPAVLTADDFLTITLAKLRTRYYVPPESSIDATRTFYMTEFDPNAEILAAFKKFNGGRTLVVNRPDISDVLAASGIEKVIISKVMYDNDEVTEYEYTGLPADENFLILAQDANGNYVIFAWYNEEIKNTYYSNNQDGVVYTVVACFQLWKRGSSEIDLVQTQDDANSPLEGTIEWNNIDNEKIVKGDAA